MIEKRKKVEARIRVRVNTLWDLAEFRTALSELVSDDEKLNSIVAPLENVNLGQSFNQPNPSSQARGRFIIIKIRVEIKICVLIINIFRLVIIIIKYIFI
jgi:hypothetical protein